MNNIHDFYNCYYRSSSLRIWNFEWYTPIDYNCPEIQGYRKLICHKIDNIRNYISYLEIELEVSEIQSYTTYIIGQLKRARQSLRAFESQGSYFAA